MNYLNTARLSLSVAIALSLLPGVARAQAGQEPAKPAAATPAKTKEELQKEKSLRELFSLLNVEATIFAETGRIINDNRKVSSDPQAFWELASKKLTPSSPVLLDGLLQSYTKIFTQEEIDSYLAFYKTPGGQKLAKYATLLQFQAVEAGRKRGNEIVEQIKAELPSDPAKTGSSDKPVSFDKSPFKSSGKVITTDSGLQYDEMTVGTGKTAVAGKNAVIHYTGTLADGTKFDSSRDRNDPITFPLGAGRVIKGFDEGITGMKVGGRRKLIIPYQLAYGENGRPPVIPAKATLIFDVELMDVKD